VAETPLSVRKPAPVPRPRARPEPPPSAAKHTPPPKQNQVRLHVNVGAEMGVGGNDLAQAIAGHTGLPAGVVGSVEIRDRYSFVDVSSEHANVIIARLNRTKLNGRKLKVKAA
jgi:ATP-dependent RNA helicase DeaD